MEQKICQSCGMPMTTAEYFGTNIGGSVNEEYCIYCFKDGKFTADVTMDEMIAHNVQYLDEFNGVAGLKLTEEQAIAQMKEYFPQLKRWKKQ
jgi:hypothetical protein